MIVQLTMGWGGEPIAAAAVTDLDRALEWLLRNAPNKAMIAPAFTYTAIERGLVIDYGSHIYFGFVPGAGLPEVNETAPASKEKRKMSKKKKDPNEVLLGKRLRALNRAADRELKEAEESGLCPTCIGLIGTKYDVAAIVVNLQHSLYECAEAKDATSVIDVDTGDARKIDKRLVMPYQRLLRASVAQFLALRDAVNAMAADCPGVKEKAEAKAAKPKAKAKAKAK